MAQREAPHPFRAIWETGDRDAWADALAPDVVLNSPILKTPFRGREAVAEVYDVLLDVLRSLEVTHEFADGDAHAFFWHAELNGRTIEGTDIVHADGHGKISEITALIRPLVDIGALAAAMGPPLSGRRGPLRPPLVRLLTLPLRGILLVADAIATRFVQRR